jgi:hypothetical protein
MNETRNWLVVRIFLGIIVLLFTLFGFVIKQDCDIDAVYLWCRLHPMSLGDVLGLVLFYGGAFYLSGLWQKWFKLSNPENSARWNWIFFATTALGIIFIWNL